MAGKKSKADKSKRPAMIATTNARKNRNVIKNNLPRFEKNEDGTLNRDKPIEHDLVEAEKWREKNSAANGKFGKFANLKKKKSSGPKKASRSEEDE